MILPNSPEVDDMEDEEDAETSALAPSDEDDGLLNSVIKDDQKQVDNGRIVNAMYNQGLSSMNTETMFDKMVQNFNQAEQIFGESLLREISGYDPKSLKRNMKIPEFQKQLKGRIKSKVRELEDDGIFNYSGDITDKGKEIAMHQLYIEELDQLEAKGLIGQHSHDHRASYGVHGDARPYKKGDSFRDIAVHSTIRKAIRRQSTEILPEHLQIHERNAKGEIELIYAIDASGSMRGKKIEAAKKAGVALAYKAIDNKDTVGLMLFAEEVFHTLRPTNDFMKFMRSIAKFDVRKQTDLSLVIEESVQQFSDTNITKHLAILTDAEATVGDDPKKKVLDAAAHAQASGITISIIGIDLEEDVREFAQQLVDIAKGKLYQVSDLDNLDKLILSDYEKSKL